MGDWTLTNLAMPIVAHYGLTYTSNFSKQHTKKISTNSFNNF
jgi:hypothetical protein